MKRKNTDKTVKEPRSKTYRQVFNADEERVRGLWTKNDRHYAQLDANDHRQYRCCHEHVNKVCHRRSSQGKP